MKYVFVIKQSSHACKLHHVAVELLKKLKSDSHQVEAVIFTDNAAALAAPALSTDELANIQMQYLKACQDLNSQLLVCGRAYRALGLNSDSCHEGFTVSGNVEFAFMIAGADKVIEL